MPASWPEQAETHRIRALECAQTAADLATEARQSGGERRRELVALCDGELVNILICLEKSKQTKLPTRQWPQFAKLSREMTQEHVEYARSKLAAVSKAEDPGQRALLAEVSTLCGDVYFFLMRAGSP